ncbi:hypothetical protein HET69_21475 [Streptomyces sp. CJ_13]|uniref:hypothetical protein n=1 Tax=Streptomyces TaxID=1883 RepID=UPI0013DDD1C1|nr:MULTISPECIES: hypothetical protein [unclassified Streptomyces]MBT1186503.1 hypothetical protein [Streptomyces sp. CJ_13]
MNVTLAPSRMMVPAALSVGVVVGVMGPLLTRQAVDGGRETVGGPVGHVVHLISSAGWSWAALAFAVGWVCRSGRRAVWLAPATLVVAVAAYYLVKLGQGEFRAYPLVPGGTGDGASLPIDWGSMAGSMTVWWIGALVFGPLLGTAGAHARDPRPHGWLLHLLVPAIAVVDMSLRLPGDPELDGQLTVDTWNVVRVTALLAAAAVTVIAARAALTARRI